MEDIFEEQLKCKVFEQNSMSFLEKDFLVLMEFDIKYLIYYRINYLTDHDLVRLQIVFESLINDEIQNINT